MKHEPPARGGRPRSDAAARLASLLAEIEAGSTEAPPRTASPTSDAPPPAGPPAGRVSTRRTPADGAAAADGAASGRDQPVPAQDPGPRHPDPDGQGPDDLRGRRVRRAERRAAAGAVGVEVAEPVAPPVAAAPARAPRTAWARVRSVAFGVVLVALIAAIPALGYAGARTVLDSRAGDVQDLVADRDAPGYQAIVDPTPTALVVQRDAEGAPTAISLVALGTGDEGGSVLFVPMDTNVENPAFLIDRLRTAWVRGGDEAFIDATGRRLTVGFTDVVDLTAADWAQVVAPVAPITVENPVEVQAGDQFFAAGPIQLAAEQVAPYLDATRDAEDDLDRMRRHEAFWQAWLDAVRLAGPDVAVPNTTTGLGPYVSTLAQGDSSMDTFAVVPSATVPPDGAKTFDVDVEAARTQITDAVPAPISPTLGFRFSVRLLNGVDGSELPSVILRRLVYGGGQINFIGNARAFGATETRIEYHEDNREDTANSVRFLLGGGTVVNEPASNETVDIVITIGPDELEAARAEQEAQDASGTDPSESTGGADGSGG